MYKICFEEHFEVIKTHILLQFGVSGILYKNNLVLDTFMYNFKLYTKLVHKRTEVVHK